MTRFDNDLCRCSRCVAKFVFVLQKEIPVTSTINIIHLYRVLLYYYKLNNGLPGTVYCSQSIR